MLSSFYTAISGLNTNALSINVIGNNLANINTVAYKASRTSFAEVLSGTLTTSTAGNPVQQGMGTISPAITQVHKQGSLYYSGRSTDIGISGNGFLVLAAGDGKAYTRAGNLTFNNTGELVSQDGYKVLGFQAINGVIDQAAGLAPVTVNKGATMPPAATQNIRLTANLNSKTAVDGRFTTTVQVFDSMGDSHTVTLTFTKTGATDWDWDATVPATDVGGDEADPPESIGTGSLSFDASGVLASPVADEVLSLAGLINGADDMDITWNLFDANGNPRITGFAADSNVASTVQDGYAASVLMDISVASNGEVSGVFSNGLIRPLAQLAVALFPNVDGLLRVNGSTLHATGASGDPAIGQAGVGGRGFITGGALEQSNVDIAEEFTNLIVAQRGYQANSRIVGTTDELYQEALNLKR